MPFRHSPENTEGEEGEEGEENTEKAIVEQRKFEMMGGSLGYKEGRESKSGNQRYECYIAFPGYERH